MVKKVYTLEEYAAIGRKIVEAQEKRRKLNEIHAKEWKEQGAVMLDFRKGLEISRKHVAQKMKCSDAVVKNLEYGFPVRDRKQRRAAYKMALENIHNERSKWITTLNKMDDENDLQNEKKDLSESCVNRR